MNKDIKLYIQKLLIFFGIFLMFILLCINIIKNQITKIELLNDPLNKIEKEIIRAAKGKGIDFNDSEELIESLRIIYNRDLKVIIDKVNETDNNN